MQGVSLPSAPLLLENREAGDYSIDLAPRVGVVFCTFNVTSPDQEKREDFGDLRFRQAMSLSINRKELNETVYFGLGTPHQYIGILPKPEFTDDKWMTYFTEYDPDRANALLDEVGMADSDGDGFRELPNGKKDRH